MRKILCIVFVLLLVGVETVKAGRSVIVVRAKYPVVKVVKTDKSVEIEIKDCVEVAKPNRNRKLKLRNPLKLFNVLKKAKGNRDD